MFRYTVTKEDYLEMARWMLLQRRGSGAAPLAKLLLSTVVQMAVVAWFLLRYRETVGEMWILLAVLSLLWAALAAWRYGFIDLRAHLLLKQMLRDPHAGEFFGEHRLSLDEGLLHLRYGTVGLELPCADITALQKSETLTYICRGKDVFEFIPAKVTALDRWPAFEEDLRAEWNRDRSAARDERARQLLADAAFAEYLSLSEDETVGYLVNMRRRAYLTREGWSGVEIFTLAFPLALTVYSAIYGQWPYVALCVLALVLFNMRLFVVFTPLYEKLVREKLEPPAEEGYLLAIHEKSAWWVTRWSAIEYPLNKLKKMIRRNGSLYLIFEKRAMLFVPPEAAGRFEAAMKGRKSLKALSSLPEELQTDTEEPLEDETQEEGPQG